MRMDTSMRPSGFTSSGGGARPRAQAGIDTGNVTGEAGAGTRPGAGARRTLQWCGAFLGLGAAGVAIGWQMGGDRRPGDQRPLSR